MFRDGSCHQPLDDIFRHNTSYTSRQVNQTWLDLCRQLSAVIFVRRNDHRIQQGEYGTDHCYKLIFRRVHLSRQFILAFPCHLDRHWGGRAGLEFAATLDVAELAGTID